MERGIPGPEPDKAESPTDAEVVSISKIARLRQIENELIRVGRDSDAYRSRLEHLRARSMAGDLDARKRLQAEGSALQEGIRLLGAEAYGLLIARNNLLDDD